MPRRHKQLDVEEIIAKNPNVNRNDLAKGADALRALEKTGAVRQYTYGIETADRKNIRHDEDEVCVVRGATIRLAR
jgi:hypothetical protein